MGFLGQAFKHGSRFLGHAAKGAQFLGRNVSHISTAAHHVNAFTNNRAVQQAAQSLGASKVLSAVQTGASGLQSGLALGTAAIPGLSRDARAVGAALGQGKRSLADLYAAARN